MKKIDMHFHTKLSDGMKTNKEVLEIIKSEEIDLIIATEHDVVNSDFRDQMMNFGIPTAYGVEISVQDYTDNKSMHILHYSKEINNLLNPKLAFIRQSRETKIIHQVEKLIQNGFIINYNEMMKYYSSKGFNTSNLVAYHIAEYLFKNQVNRDVVAQISGKKDMSTDTFYKAFLKRGGDFAHIGHFEIGNYEFDINDIEFHKIQSSIFSLAHPNETFKEDYDYFEEKVDKLVGFGLNAIEINPLASKKYVDLIKYLKLKYDLILSFGSDCHFVLPDGKHSQLFDINPNITERDLDENLERIKDKLGLLAKTEKYIDLEMQKT